jgi:hypothetical protein
LAFEHNKAGFAAITLPVEKAAMMLQAKTTIRKILCILLMGVKCLANKFVDTWGVKCCYI